MTDDVEMEAGGETHVGFESECFLLLAPTAHNPLHRERARQQTNGEMGILKPTRGKMKSGLEPGAASLPSQIGDAAFSKACRPPPPPHHRGGAPVALAGGRPQALGKGRGPDLGWKRRSAASEAPLHLSS